jgi:iron complex outermembrane receptor protein
MEVEAVWGASRNVQVTANFAWQESIDESTNKDAGYAPRKHAFVRSDWRMSGDWMLSSRLNRVADRRRVPGDTRTTVPDYTTLDLTLRNTLEKGKWEIAASVLNLFNATVLEPTLFAAAPGSVPGYPTSLIPYDLPVSPRTIWLQTEYKL